MGQKIESFEGLEVYRKLCVLSHEIFEVTLKFPAFERYELGSQLRRAANSSPANIAEGWNNKHINIYLEGINRALGELRETRHHLSVAYKRKYIDEKKHQYFVDAYDECGRMLKGLERSLERYKK